MAAINQWKNNLTKQAKKKKTSDKMRSSEFYIP